MGKEKYIKINVVISGTSGRGCFSIESLIFALRFRRKHLHPKRSIWDRCLSLPGDRVVLLVQHRHLCRVDQAGQQLRGDPLVQLDQADHRHLAVHRDLGDPEDQGDLEVRHLRELQVCFERALQHLRVLHRDQADLVVQVVPEVQVLQVDHLCQVHQAVQVLQAGLVLPEFQVVQGVQVGMVCRLVELVERRRVVGDQGSLAVLAFRGDPVYRSFQVCQVALEVLASSSCRTSSLASSRWFDWLQRH